MPLIQPITNRTLADVIYADARPDNQEASKGALNYTDLNRIESNCAYLAGQLNTYGYSIDITVKTDWIMQDFPYQGQIDRIRHNVDALLDALYRLPDSPQIRYWNSLDWNDINSLEQNLKNIDTLLQRMAAVFLRCGDAHGGDR
ncbi:hypothetical protein Ami103574_04500 [Aminipila butyrica]|uniref:Uncharacterized protein n=1 Tax=Aminipila butyrica TaxID=433296 RepID=A0A858BRT9_9FIRM|nr:hypothetical protein [Aminipila butyrica]QIB68623.1 hypothetical protein Ami103574_04500 [Aminipila butyrica]